MNGVIYYLLMSFTAKKKKKKQGQVHQTNAVKAEPNWPHQFCVSAKFSIETANIF